MKPSLQMRQSQHLALTPQLQQSIRLLQLSTLELNQEIEQILAQNPLLDRDDDPYDAHVRLNGDGSLQESAPGSAPAASGDLPADRREPGDPPVVELDGALQSFSD